MLSELLIENFAIIDRLLLRFEPGFTVLTGETGAGKSIIVDALQCALGGRTSADAVRADARMASVEAVFELIHERGAVRQLLEENGIEDDGTVILRREIQAAGRSSARVNGRAVPNSVLAAIGAALVDIHGQSEHLSILRRDRQLDVLDRFGDLLELRGRVGEAVRAHLQARRELEQLESGEREAAQRLDLLRFQVQEIEAAQLSEGEEDELTAHRNRLANAERLASLAADAYDALSGGAGAVLEGLDRAVSAARELCELDPALASWSERVTAARYEVEDLAQEARRYRDAVEFDPDRLNEIEERLDLVGRLKRKYGPSLADVIEFGAHAARELEQIERFDERRTELGSEVERLAAETGLLAGQLSNERAKAADRLERDARTALQGLGLKSTDFRVELSTAEDPHGVLDPGRGQRLAVTARGFDSVTFVVSFNPGEPLRPLERVASGGETSRFLLALRSVLSAADGTPTLVFDEVDVGVGGRAGGVVGERLRELATRHQVMSITHLPQVAAVADHHLTVFKVASNGRTTVGVRTLEADDRVSELAEMMSGTESAAARKSAAELLSAARHEG